MQLVQLTIIHQGNVVKRIDSPQTIRHCRRAWLLVAEESFKARARETLTLITLND